MRELSHNQKVTIEWLDDINYEPYIATIDELGNVTVSVICKLGHPRAILLKIYRDGNYVAT